MTHSRVLAVRHGGRPWIVESDNDHSRLRPSSQHFFETPQDLHTAGDTVALRQLISSDSTHPYAPHCIRIAVQSARLPAL